MLLGGIRRTLSKSQKPHLRIWASILLLAQVQRFSCLHNWHRKG